MLFAHLAIPLTIIKAHGWWSRLRGLLGRINLPRDQGLWLKPCSSIHTVGMLFVIDVVFLDKNEVILGLRSGIVPFWFAVAPKGAHSVLELAEGGIEVYRLAVGDRLDMG